MKNPIDVLRMKEQELRRVEVEVEALRITARLLTDDVPPTKASQRQDISPVDFDALASSLDTRNRW